MFAGFIEINEYVNMLMEDTYISFIAPHNGNDTDPRVQRLQTQKPLHYFPILRFSDRMRE